MSIQYDTYVLGKKQKMKYYFSAMAITISILYLFYNSFLFSFLLSPLIAYFFRKQYLNFLIKKRRELLNNQFMELLQSLSSSISAGRQMEEAVEEGLLVLSSSYAEDSPMVVELQHMVKSIKESREGVEQLLRNFATRAKISDITNFVEVYSICKETGGDMEKAINRTSRIIIDKLSIERDMRVLSAQKKFEGKLISLMPVGVILFLRATSPAYIEPLYSTLAGKVIMTASILGIGYAYYLTEKITKVSL